MKVLIILMSVLVLSGCAKITGGATTRNQDLQKSPCACVDEIHFKGIKTNKVV